MFHLHACVRRQLKLITVNEPINQTCPTYLDSVAETHQ